MKYSVARTLTILLTAICAWAQPPIRLKARAVVREGRLSSRIPQARRLTGHYILQFRTYPGAEARAELAHRGIRVLQYVPDNGLLVSAGPVPLNGLDLAWSGYLDASDKISPLLAQQTAGTVLAVFHPDIEAAIYRALVSSL